MFMLVRNVSLLWFSFIFCYLTTTLAQPDFYYHFCGNNPSNLANYTENSTFKKNLDTTLSNLPSTNNGFGFFNLSIGQGIDRVYSAALCRGDVTPDVCQSCLSDAIVKVRKVCPNNIYVVGYYAKCYLTYANNTEWRNFRAYVSQPFSDKDESAKTLTTMNQFNQALLELMDKLRNDTKIGGPLRKFATGNIRGPDFKTIYGLMQCTPDISEVECNVCTGLSIRFIPDNFNYSWGGKVVSPLCYLEYHLQQFFNDSIPLSNTPSSSSLPLPPGKKKNTMKTVTIVTVIMTFVGVIIIASLFILVRLKRMKKVTRLMDIVTAESFQYDFSTVKVATNDFSEDNKLGQGGFGAVYKGVLEDGQEIAVKRLADDSGQGDLEFKNEVVLVAKLQHRNLVRLLGFSIHGRERLLIYELLPNASLDHFIFDPMKRTFLNWEKRYEIIKGIAKGLLYLHEDSRLKIIHRDIKASNILLDGELNAKIADFGLARWFKLDESQADASRVVGTHAYMAPEYIRHGHFSVKTDVFSFGVLVLEIVAGQRNHGFQNGETMQNLLSFAWKRWQNGTPSDMMDPTLKTGFAGSLRNIIRIIHIGLLCVQENVTDRPTMGSVVLMLNSLAILLPEPSKPAFLVHSMSTDPEMPLLLEFSSSSGSSGLERRDVSTNNFRSFPFSVNDATVSEIVPR